MTTTLTITEDLRDRVNRGTALLDQHEPGWADHINTALLDLWGCDVCVLGQLYGGYKQGIRELFNASLQDEAGIEQAKAHGFDTHDTSESYDALTYAWLHAIDDRRA